MSHADRLSRAARKLRNELRALDFSPPVTHVYDPLEYAWRPHREYLMRFGDSQKRVVFLGMNPGPFGMAQTGVPFGEIPPVRDWLQIEAKVGKPAREHPKRPVDGFACTRQEISGQRVWGTLAAHYKKPEDFFKQHFISNYCPLVFMEESGRNRTPDKLPRKERDALFALCDEHLTRVVRILEPEWVIGIGAFARERAQDVVGDRAKIGTILHPSPANPRANRDWAGEAKRQLSALGLCGAKKARASKRRA